MKISHNILKFLVLDFDTIRKYKSKKFIIKYSDIVVEHDSGHFLHRCPHCGYVLTKFEGTLYFSCHSCKTYFIFKAYHSPDSLYATIVYYFTDAFTYNEFMEKWREIKQKEKELNDLFDLVDWRRA